MNTKKEIGEVYLINNMDDLEIITNTKLYSYDTALYFDKMQLICKFSACIKYTYEFSQELNSNILLFHTIDKNDNILLFHTIDKNVMTLCKITNFTNLTISNDEIIFNDLEALESNEKIYYSSYQHHHNPSEHFCSALSDYYLNLIKQYKRDKKINMII